MHPNRPLILNFMYRLSIISVCLLLLIASPAWGQADPARHSHAHPLMEEIQASYGRGEITMEQRVLYKFYAGLNQQKLPDRFLPYEGYRVKCGTPAILDFRKHRDRLSPSAIMEIERMVNSDKTDGLQAAESYLSGSGKFLLHYETTGSNAVPSDDNNGNGVPDYVEWTAAAADSSWRHEVGTLGFTDPILPGEPYEVYFRDFSFYGQTVASANTTYIEIHHTFENFPENTDPDGDVRGAIKVTMAHEFKHAIQYAATRWTGESDRWAEMDATLMEEVVYDVVNDYYNYLLNPSSIFLSPSRSIYPGSYYHVTWALYFEQKYGPFFWPRVWERIKADPTGISYVEAMTEEVGGEQLFQADYTTSHLWHYAAGPTLSATNYGFEERQQYPSPTINQTGQNQVLFDSLFTQNLAARYFQVDSDRTTGGLVTLRFRRLDDLDAQKIGLGLFVLSGGELQSRYVEIGGQRDFLYQSPWRWDEIDQIQVAVTNGSEVQSARYQLEFTATEPPARITLGQNYPNPFSLSTVIPFTLDERTRVKLRVYDITGRLVRELVDEERPPGLYGDVTFEGGSLASGIYIYRLVTDSQSLTGKMTLIK